MASTRGAGPARIVLGADVAAPDATRAGSRVCEPGSLDASRVAGAVVLCERGELGRVDKSAAVEQADGVGMVLVNTAPGPTDADFHSVPTVHLDLADGLALRRWVAGHPDGRVALRPVGVERVPARAVAFTPSGDPTSGILKPDVVAPGRGRPRRGAAQRAEHPLGLRVRHLGRGRPHQRRRRRAARPPRLAGGRRPLRPRDDRRRGAGRRRLPGGRRPAADRPRRRALAGLPDRAGRVPRLAARATAPTSTRPRSCSGAAGAAPAARSRTWARGRCPSPRAPSASSATTCG